MFAGDWSEEVNRDLVAGSSVLIVYDGSRLPGRDTMYGERAWGIYAEYKFDDGSVHEQKLEGPKMVEGTSFFMYLIV